MAKTPKKIVVLGESLSRITKQLETTNPAIVMFVDLCGSTQLKTIPQATWLPIVCQFLLETTRVITKEGGRVVKYIGDEVMAVFSDHDGLGVARAETCIRALDTSLRSLGDQFVAKYVMDAGNVAEVSFPPDDVLGTTVDRCARIAKIAQPGVALASAEVRNRAPNRGSWISVGAYSFKGIPVPVKVFMLSGLTVMSFTNFPRP